MKGTAPLSEASCDEKSVLEQASGGSIAFPENVRMTRVVLAGALGTCFEAYDLFLVGTMAAVISRQFFSGVNPTAGLIFTLLGFAAGYLVRPLGAIFFGRIADQFGRKRVFVASVALMGIATALIGVLPTYGTAGLLAPLAFLALRLIQGFALGGEAGGAMVYVVEHSPPNRRGLHTSWVQLAPMVGLLLSQIVLSVTRGTLGESAFLQWAWRVPFLVSLVLLALSIWIRSRMGESPEFERLRDDGAVSRAPLREALTGRRNITGLLCALLGFGPGAAGALYAAFFYTPFFLTQVLHVNSDTTNWLSASALVAAMPLFILFGALSDRIGRKTVICVGFVLVVVLYPSVFRGLTHFANPALAVATSRAPVVVIADPKECSTQFNLLGTAKFVSSCDVAKAALVRMGVSYENVAAPGGTSAMIRIGEVELPAYDAKTGVASQRETEFSASLRRALAAAGYPSEADSSQVNLGVVWLLLFVLGVLAAMTYGPLAAAMSELFPTGVRFTALSLSYHIGFGWTGGLLPAAAFAMATASGNIYAGLAYPRVAAIVGFIFIVAFSIVATGRKTGKE
ncbi:MFS transporter [Burkholderia ambifaria]|uniref:MFS transporter n=1 Tax=Burkholderia ambifaria TaxID=152480 RepID=UPI003BB52BD7